MKYDGLWAIERHALQIYTRAAFELFRQQVKSASYYILSERDGDVYTIHMIALQQGNIGHVSISRLRWLMVVKNLFVSGMYDRMGILCCHAIRVSD